MIQEWNEVERGRLWQTSVGNILTVYVAKTSAGTFEARVVGMGGPIDITSDLHFGGIAQDIGLAMAHRILRDEMLRLEGKTADEYYAALAAPERQIAYLSEQSQKCRESGMEKEADVLALAASALRAGQADSWKDVADKLFVRNERKHDGN